MRNNNLPKDMDKKSNLGDFLLILGFILILAWVFYDMNRKQEILEQQLLKSREVKVNYNLLAYQNKENVDVY